MIEVFNYFLGRIIEFKIFPFAPLEINFIINLSWVVFKSLFKSFSDYRVTKEEGQEQTSGFFIFAEIQITTFLLSFLTTFAVFLSLDFWLAILDISKSGFIWWLPSVISIVLAEASGATSKLFPEKKERLEFFENPEIKKTLKKTSHLSVYFFLVFFCLTVFWLIMVLKHIIKLF